MSTVHFRFVPDPSVAYGPLRGYPACGEQAKFRLTSDAEKVTCRRCWRSGPYRKVHPEPPMTAADALKARGRPVRRTRPTRPAPKAADLGTCRSEFCGNAAAPSRAGWCSPCHRRWIDHGRPAGGPPPPRRAGRLAGAGPAADRIEDYVWLREEQGLTRIQAAVRLGITKRTALRYDARLRAQAAASQDLTLAA